jgi:asparagine synthase (glutamine-hydrolysing)
MAEALQHRGPDDRGAWADQRAGLVLAHRRLAVVDLSAAGHQPMESQCGRFVLTYNGEIYNHTEIREKLVEQGFEAGWRGHSDTETLLAAFVHWGFGPTLDLLNGMFALAFWDRLEQKLLLARDRMGEKPLYYGFSGDTFLFASELKAFRRHPAWRGEVNRDALSLFFRHQYIPAPYSIYRDVHKLQPAHYAVVQLGGGTDITTHCYWNLARVAEAGLLVAEGRDHGVLADDLDALLRDAVGKRMMADVPLGAFLSGGYDSSMVVALMQVQSRRPVKTFSIGFDDEAFNEAPHAKAVAEHLGTDHTELYVTPTEALAVIPQLPTIWDEPFSDSSQIPTYLVSKLARQHVTVSLSGDGGDELFYGYGRYLLAERIWRKLELLPAGLRKVLGAALTHAPGHTLELLSRLLPERLRISNLGDRLPKLAPIVARANAPLFYRELVSHWKQPDKLVLGGIEPATAFTMREELPALPELAELMMYLDATTYLPDDILTKVDRASMAVSLEARVPLLDHRVVEFAWQVPTSQKRGPDGGKQLLREVLHRYVPRSLMDRPKMGFGVPLEQWLRGPLRGWGESLLDEKKLRREGFLNPALVRRMWEEHISGQRRWHYYLWDVLMFEAWLDQTSSE